MNSAAHAIITDWPYTAKEPDKDPLDDTLGHGTHVAGIIAGKGEWFKGVAPEATIMSYKVFSAQGGVRVGSLLAVQTRYLTAKSRVLRTKTRSSKPSYELTTTV